MGDLPRLTGMDFDRLRHIGLNPVARAAEYGLNGAEGRRLQGERFSMGRSLQEPAEPLGAVAVEAPLAERRSEEHTSELQSLMRISYAVFCLKKKTQNKANTKTQYTKSHRI